MKIWLGLVAWLGLSLACPWPLAPAQELSGGELARRQGCWACHSGTIASRLEGIGTRRSPGELQQILTQPRVLLPQVKMPSYAYLPPQERQALLDFLLNLK